MKFDDSGYRCQELVDIAQAVFAKIPRDAQERIKSACSCVVFLEDGDTEAEYFDDRCEIHVFARRIRDFTVKGRRGIVAHEFGHAYDVAIRGAKPGDTAETMANIHAQDWGFVSDLRARDKDAASLRQ